MFLNQTLKPLKNTNGYIVFILNNNLGYIKKPKRCAD
jgi:hypothetical protein